MKKRISVIIISIVLCFVGITLFIFHDESDFWVRYFWLLNVFFGVLGYLFNYQKEKTDIEMTFITFFVSFRVLLMVYTIIGWIFATEAWMDSVIYFLIITFVSGFFALLYWYLKTLWKRREILFARH